MLMDENTSCSTAGEFQRTIQELSRYDDEISIGGVLSLAQTEKDKLQHDLYRRVRAKAAAEWLLR